MKILIIAHDMGTFGGVGSFSSELARALAALGHEVAVIARRDGEEVQGVRMYGFHAPKIPPKDVVFLFLNSARMERVVEGERPDVVHDTASALPFLPRVPRDVSVVQTVHGSPLLGDIRRMYTGLRDALRAALFDISHRLPPRLISALRLSRPPKPTRLVFVSWSSLIDALMRLKPEARERLGRISRVVYNGVDVDGIRARAEKSYDPHSIAVVTRLVEYKGVRRAVEAMSIVIKEVPEARMHVVGEGPLLRELIALARRLGLEGRVTFHGWLPRSLALRLVSRCAVLVHLSLYESFGYSIVEAYALGKPVVAHRAPYSVELVELTGAGLTADLRRVEEVAEAIATLLSDKGLYRRLSSRALRVSEELFSSRRMAEGYVRVYEEALGGAGFR